ncbi:MAG: FliA/WhiG family RNA polymerase sigma factor [Sedimentisphaerales bacterium]|nr:FliA/WhiG family RNA polymerase sigma factor [Sedimentisphaerales bacterium]
MPRNRSEIQTMDIADVWQKFQAHRDDNGTQYRNRLIEEYLPLVKYNAERIYAKLPDEVELDDLISAGIFGLKDAIEAFDMTRGVKFETYCAPRVRGAILDELRAMDWVPRLVRSRGHKLEEAAKSFEAENGRGGTDEEIAERMGLGIDDFIKLKRDATAVTLVSLSRKWFETDSQKDVCEIDVLEDKRGQNPYEETQKRDLKEMMTKGLSRAERLILILYYYEEMTMKEIGATLDLSESRVSQMHSSILARLKAQMSHQKKKLHV